MLKTIDDMFELAAERGASDILFTPGVPPAIRRVIRDNETHLLAGMIETGQSLGMQTMDMAISRLVADNRVTADDALANAQDPEKMKRLLAA